MNFFNFKYIKHMQVVLIYLRSAIKKKVVRRFLFIKIILILFLTSPSLYSLSTPINSNQSTSRPSISNQNINLNKLNNIFSSTNKYQPYLELGGIKYFNQEPSGAGIYDLFLPLLVGEQDNKQLLFTDLRIFDRTGSSFEGNAHLGYRVLIPETKQLYGFYASFDRKRSDSSIIKKKNYFNQITIGGEYWQDKWFIGGNLYTPIGKKKRISTQVTASDLKGLTQKGSRAITLVIDHTSTLPTTHSPIKTKKIFEKSLYGLDAEIGHAFTDDLTGYAGGYWFQDGFFKSSKDREAKTKWGPRLRLTYNYHPANTKRFLGFLDGASLEAGIQHDKPRGTSGYIGFSIKVGLTNSEKTTSNLSGFERHMTELVRRDPDIIVGEAREETFRQEYYQEGEHGFVGKRASSDKSYSERIDYKNWPFEELLKELDLPATASLIEVRKAYRSLSLIHHPDKTRDDGSKQGRINGVYEELGNRFFKVDKKSARKMYRPSEPSFPSRSSSLALLTPKEFQLYSQNNMNHEEKRISSFSPRNNTHNSVVISHLPIFNSSEMSVKKKVDLNKRIMVYVNMIREDISHSFQNQLSKREARLSNNSIFFQKQTSASLLSLNEVHLNQSEFKLSQNKLGRNNLDRRVLEIIGSWVLMPLRWIDYGMNVFFEILMPIKGAYAWELESIHSSFIDDEGNTHYQGYDKNGVSISCQEGGTCDLALCIGCFEGKEHSFGGGFSEEDFRASVGAEGTPFQSYIEPSSFGEHFGAHSMGQNSQRQFAKEHQAFAIGMDARSQRPSRRGGNFYEYKETYHLADGKQVSKEEWYKHRRGDTDENKQGIRDKEREHVKNIYSYLGHFPPNEKLKRVTAFFFQPEEEYKKYSIEVINKAREEAALFLYMHGADPKFHFKVPEEDRVDEKEVISQFLDLFKTDSFGEGTRTIATRVFQAIERSWFTEELKKEASDNIKLLDEGKLEGRQAAHKIGNLFHRGLITEEAYDSLIAQLGEFSGLLFPGKRGKNTNRMEIEERLLLFRKFVCNDKGMCAYLNSVVSRIADLSGLEEIHNNFIDSLSRIPEKLERIGDVLKIVKPKGKYIGDIYLGEGEVTPSIRDLEGGEVAGRNLFERLTRGNKIRKGFDSNIGEEIEVARLRDGTKIGYQSSNEGPSVDIYNIPKWMEEDSIKLRFKKIETLNIHQILNKIYEIYDRDIAAWRAMIISSFEVMTINPFHEIIREKAQHALSAMNIDVSNIRPEAALNIIGNALGGGALSYVACGGLCGAVGGALGGLSGGLGGAAVGARVGAASCFPTCSVFSAGGAAASGTKAGFENVYFSKNSGKEGAGKGGESSEKVLRIVKEAGEKKGFFGLGSGTRAEADAAGKAWIGKDARWSSKGNALISKDKLRQYRPPLLKKGKKIVQANLESRLVPKGDWINNGHLDIID